MDPFEELLSTIGFAGADAADSLGRAYRDRERTRYDIGLAGEEERRGINASMEERGLINSGARGMTLARQAGRETAALTDADIAFGDTVNGVQRDITRAQAEEQARQAALTAERSNREADYTAELGLINTGRTADLDSAMRRWQTDMSAIEAARRISERAAPVPSFNPSYIDAVIRGIRDRDTTTRGW